MPDYSKGKIYKIWSPSADIAYYGSTIETLSKRLTKHRGGLKRWKRGTTNYVTSYGVLEHPDARIDLVEKFPCECVEELRAREGFYIKNFECVNRCVAGRINKEYQKDNRERIKEYKKEYCRDNKEKKAQYDKEYRKANKERLNERDREKILCTCGIITRRGDKAKHERTEVHRDLIELFG